MEGFPLPLRERARERGATRRALSVCAATTSEKDCESNAHIDYLARGTPLPTLSRKGRGSLSGVLTSRAMGFAALYPSYGLQGYSFTGTQISNPPLPVDASKLSS